MAKQATGKAARKRIGAGGKKPHKKGVAAKRAVKNPHKAAKRKAFKTGPRKQGGKFRTRPRRDGSHKRNPQQAADEQVVRGRLKPQSARRAPSGKESLPGTPVAAETTPASQGLPSGEPQEVEIEGIDPDTVDAPPVDELSGESPMMSPRTHPGDRGGDNSQPGN